MHELVTNGYARITCAGYGRRFFCD
jgi:hypothetical protein